MSYELRANSNKLKDVGMMRRAKTFGMLCLLIALVCLPHLYSQKPALRFQRYTVEEGLAQGSIFCILQDRNGFMWFGTEQGLNRFDGYNFQVYKFQYDNPNSLSDSYVLSLYEEPSGVMWIGTQGGGLNKLVPDTGKVTRFLIDPQILSSPGNIINVIHEDAAGILWIGTKGAGLKIFDREKETFTPFPFNKTEAHRPGPKIINCMGEDRSGTLRIGAQNGLYQLDREKNKIESIPFPQKRILSLYEDRTGQFWVGTDKGFYQFEPGTGLAVHHQPPADEGNRFRADRVQTFFEDSSGTFWIGTQNGLYIFDRERTGYYRYSVDRSNPHSLINNLLTTIFEDSSGALWVGTRSGGLHKLNRTRPSFQHHFINPEHSRGLSNWGIFSFYESRGGLMWIGTNGEGLFLLNRDTGELKHYRNQPEDPGSLSNNTIWALCEDRRGVLWAGTAGGGLNRFSPDTGKFTHYRHQPQNPNSLCNDTISTIIEDRKGSLWIGTNGGLNRFDPLENRFVHYRADPNVPDTLVHNQIYVLYEDRRGRLWVGTSQGADTFDPDTETFTTNQLNPRGPNIGLPYQVFSICEDREGTIWLGTTGGLNKIDPEKGFEAVYDEKDGLANDVINGLLEDHQGNLWLSTNKGLSRFDPRTEKFNNYSMADGLQSYEFNGGAYFKNSKGELFFGGIDGFNDFFPHIIKDNPYVPPVVFTDLQVLNQTVSIGEKVRGHIILEKSITASDTVTLTHKHHIFSIGFAALNYIHNEENEYAIMMEGLDDSWNYVGRRRSINYANLAPGEYTFRVKASNNHGVWNEKGAALKITILPPYWATWWFRVSLGLVVLILVLTAFRVRTRIIMKRILQEERMKMARLESTRILAGGIAHDFNNLLATIIGNIDLALLEAPHGTTLRKVIEAANRSSLKAADLVHQFLTFSKGGILIKKTVRIQRIVRDSVRSVLRDSGVKCRFNLPADILPVDCDVLQISQAVKNIVVNSKQAMAEDGVLEVSAENKTLSMERVSENTHGKFIQISFKDNGAGITKKNLARVFEPYFTTRSDVTQKGLGLGLSVTHAIITKHDGTIQVASEVGEGTTVRICLPASDSSRGGLGAAPS